MPGDARQLTHRPGARRFGMNGLHRWLDGLGGLYLEDFDVAGPCNGELGSRGVASWAIDPVAARRLWDISKAMTGAYI
ncbi:hypothetical protein PZN02_004467 [Sinorhizobium garamanticum]|uniref:Uncharacterized protein n=1 Tax=Sinorhizobium garamanticum TaxID=680247 RepID=A0ABY8DIZ2_9HYPH|nr:hypothetical protein [Sinorhizobium garamanticum]WEX90889.1 hypothetical protein PZN02_004467 [Sinorhizobium garamanticum]